MAAGVGFSPRALRLLDQRALQAVASLAQERRRAGPRGRQRTRSSRWNVPPLAAARSATMALVMPPAAPVTRNTDSRPSVSPGAPSADGALVQRDRPAQILVAADLDHAGVEERLLDERAATAPGSTPAAKSTALTSAAGCSVCTPSRSPATAPPSGAVAPSVTEAEAGRPSASPRRGTGPCPPTASCRARASSRRGSSRASGSASRNASRSSVEERRLRRRARAARRRRRRRLRSPSLSARSSARRRRPASSAQRPPTPCAASRSDERGRHAALVGGHDDARPRRRGDAGGQAHVERRAQRGHGHAPRDAVGVREGNAARRRHWPGRPHLSEGSGRRGGTGHRGRRRRVLAVISGTPAQVGPIGRARTSPRGAASGSRAASASPGAGCRTPRATAAKVSACFTVSTPRSASRSRSSSSMSGG